MSSNYNGQVRTAAAGIGARDEFLPAELCLRIYQLMVRSRAMEERMIKMSKSGEGFFWIGGPGEEAFNVALGLQIKKGQGPDFDFLHLHYRNSATMVAMGMPLLDGIRQMAMAATDPHSVGRNFPSHFSMREWRCSSRWRRARPSCRSVTAATPSPSSSAATPAPPKATSPPA